MTAEINRFWFAARDVTIGAGFETVRKFRAGALPP